MSSNTPEGATKKKIKRVLDNYKPHSIYYYMPVPGGFGASTLDYIGFLNGRGFAIEAKRPRGKPTERQVTTIEQIRASGAAVFVVNDDASLARFEQWCGGVTEEAGMPPEKWLVEFVQCLKTCRPSGLLNTDELVAVLALAARGYSPEAAIAELGILPGVPALIDGGA